MDAVLTFTSLMSTLSFKQNDNPSIGSLTRACGGIQIWFQGDSRVGAKPLFRTHLSAIRMSRCRSRRLRDQGKIPEQRHVQATYSPRRCAAFGVSTATVSRYFGGKANALAPETLEVVRKAAETLGYTPSEIGRSLRLARSRVVVMMVPDAANTFTTDVAASVEQALKKYELSMVLANSAEDPDQQDRLLTDAHGLRARAIILQGAIDTPPLRAMAVRQENIIFVNRRPPNGIVAPTWASTTTPRVWRLAATSPTGLRKLRGDFGTTSLFRQ